MECKYLLDKESFNLSPELIDTLWNVNQELAVISKFQLMELIDTLWNVNHACNDRKLSCPGELIDTLWNVNLCTAS